MNSVSFPSCCGADILMNFPTTGSMELVKRDIKNAIIEIKNDIRQDLFIDAQSVGEFILLATLEKDSQRNAIKVLKNMGFKSIAKWNNGFTGNDLEMLAYKIRVKVTKKDIEKYENE